ncbi:MAG: hypothetical protein NCW75_10780 [Phycisphaera sp.]|nr:MAG: hypothetical protein NCW75_10780 [Phycisphaera sp.]
MRHVQTTVGLLTLVALSAAPVQAQILVYDQNSNNSYALAAAEFVMPGEVVHAVASDFGSLLDSQEWDLVVLDFPSTRPDSGQGVIVDYVNDGGRVILSTWFSIYSETPGLFEAFGASGGTSISLGTNSVDTTGTAAADAVFDGVTMPWFDWLSAWGSDGVAFDILPDTEGLATVSDASGHVKILANEGRTIATFLMDVWDGSTEAERVWENMMNLVLDGAPSCRVDMDMDGSLTIFDFLAFQNAFDAGDLIADFDGDGSLTIFDFLAFQNEFDLGCE